MPLVHVENTTAEGGVVPKKRKYKFKTGTVVTRVIKKLQTSTKLLLRKAPFRKLVREIASDTHDGPIMFKQQAMEALQEACEDYMVESFREANKHAKHAKRKTISIKDIQMLSHVKDRTSA
jgi:histone H3